MYDNNCFHKQVCIMVEQGEGKIKATFCSLSRAEDSISRGWRFYFPSVSVGNKTAHQTTPRCSGVHTTWQWLTFVSSGADGFAGSPGVNSEQRYVTTAVGVAGASPVCLCGKQ